MRHDHDSAPSGARASSAGGSGAWTSATFAGACVGKGLAARIDPAQLERQRRQRQRERPPDMAGAEEIDRAGAFAERLASSPPRQAAFRSGLAAPIAFQLTRSIRPSAPDRRAERSPAPAPRRPRAPRSPRRSRASKVSIRHSTRPPQHCASSGPSATTRARRAAALLQRRPRLRERRPLQRAAADRAVEAARRPHDHPRARLARARSLGLGAS